MSERRAPDPTQRKYMTAQEVAAYYNVSARTLIRRAGKDLPRKLRVGGQWRWWGPDIVEFDRRLREAAE